MPLQTVYSVTSTSSKWDDECACCNSADEFSEHTIAWCCPCYVAGKNAERAGTGSCHRVGLQIGLSFILMYATWICGGAGYDLQESATYVNADRLVCLYVEGCSNEEGAPRLPNPDCEYCGESEDPNIGLAMMTCGFVGFVVMNVVKVRLHLSGRKKIGDLLCEGHDHESCAFIWYCCGCHCGPLIQEKKGSSKCRTGRALPPGPVGEAVGLSGAVPGR